MYIKLNGKDIELYEARTVADMLAYSYYQKSLKVIYILNGFNVAVNSPLKDGDELYIIPKDMEINSLDLECFLTSRHSNDVVKKLKNSRVAILGLGGLGSNTAMYLARSGVGYMKLIDFDIVDPSNINRQNYFLDQIGKKKTIATYENLKRVNPYGKYQVVDDYIDNSNYDKYLHDVDIIIEAFDSPVCKADLTNYFLKNYREKCHGKYLICASGMAGYYKSNLIKTKKLKERLFICGDGVNSAKEFDGLMSPRVSIVAGHQANCLIRILMQEMEG